MTTMIITSLQEFYSFFQPNKPVLAIDYGGKKIGIAISSPDHFMAMPHSIILASKEPEKLEKIARIASQNNICALVIGLPVHMDGTHSDQTKTVINFAEKLSKKTNLPIYLQDERLTSRAADSLLKTMGLNRKQRNERDDMAAASLILETTLESVKRM
jgi:putative Holliday junction resolvase